jgi:hypothetical protein
MMNYFTINPYTATPHPQQVFVVENIKPLAPPPMEILFNTDGTQPKKRAGRKRKEPTPDTSYVVDQTMFQQQQSSMLDNSCSNEQASPNSASTSDDDERATKRRKTLGAPEDQKNKHNLTSKKGRMRINTEIMSLKELLPECREVECNKASILHCTVQTLKRMQVTTTQLALTNAKLEKDNKKIIKMNKRLYEEVIKLRGALGEAVPNISAFDEESNEQEETVLAGQVFESNESSDSAPFPSYVQQSSPLPQMEVHGEISIPMTAMALAEQALPSTEYGAMPSFATYPSLPVDFAAPTKYTYTDSAVSDAVSSSFPAHSSSFDFSAADFNMMPAFNNYNASLMFVLFFTVPFLFSESTGPALTQLTTSAGTSRTLNWLSTAADSTFTFTPTAIVLALAALCFTVVLVCWALSLRGWHKQTAHQSSISLPVRRRKSSRTSFWSSVARVFNIGSTVDTPAPAAVKKIEI